MYSLSSEIGILTCAIVSLSLTVTVLSVRVS